MVLNTSRKCVTHRVPFLFFAKVLPWRLRVTMCITVNNNTRSNSLFLCRLKKKLSVTMTDYANKDITAHFFLV